MDGPTPWYKRDILPAWLPGWLAGSMLIAAGFAVMFGLFLDDPNPLYVGATAGAGGFVLAIVIFSVAAVQYRGRGPNRFAPPAVVRYPVVTALVVVWPLAWVHNREIRQSWSRGGTTLVSGDAAEWAGLAGLLVLAGVIGWWAVSPQARGRRLPALLSLAVAVGGLAYATYLIARHHAG